ncbi:MAG: ATP-binding protein [Ruminiclostridium sp.]
MKLYGKEKLTERLAEFAEAGRFPHAVLFSGDKGTGKSVMAKYTAKLFLCEKKGGIPCDMCAACHKAEKNIHPDLIDVLWEMPKGKYAVTELRELLAEGIIKPNDGDVKVYVFREAETMNDTCQNALLKFIEEPSDFNRFVFTANSVGAILPTILSRVVTISMPPCGEKDCKAALIDSGIPEDKSEELIADFGANIGKCLDAYGNETEMQVVEIVKAISQGLAEKNEFKTAAAFARLSNRDLQQKALPLLLKVFRDGMVYTAELDSFESPCREQAVRLAQSVPLKRLDLAAREIQTFIERQSLNPNVQLACAVYASRLCELIL